MANRGLISDISVSNQLDTLDIELNWLDYIGDHGDIDGVILLNANGKPIRSTMYKEETLLYTELALQLSDKARAIVRDLESNNDLKILRVVSKRREIIIASEENNFLLVIIQRLPMKKLKIDEKL